MRRNLPLLAVLSLAAFLLFFNLGTSSLHTWDEAGHSLVAREILDSGQWLSLQLDGEPYLKKTPLKFWLTALTFKAFGINEWTVRIWSAFFAFATIVALCILGDRALGRPAGAFAGLILVTSHQYLYKHCARTGDVDSYFIFFWTAAMLLLLLALQKRSAPLVYLSFLSVGFCGLAKHLGLVPQVLVVVALFLLLSGAWRVFPARVWLTGLGLAILVVLPWTMVQIAVHGSSFFDVHFGREVMARAAEGLPGTPRSRLGSWYYLDTLKNGMFPWSLLIPFALVLVWRQRRGENKQTNLLILIWIAIVFLTVFLSTGKAHRYILPAYPALALLVGQLLAPIGRRRASSLALVAVLVSLYIVGLSTSTVATHNPFVIGEREQMISVDILGRLIEAGASLAPWLIAAAAIFIAILGWELRNRIPVAQWALAALVGVAILQVAIPMKDSDHRHPFDLVVEDARQLQDEGLTVWTTLPNLYRGRPFFGFYLRLLEPPAVAFKPNPDQILQRLGSESVAVLGTSKMADAISDPDRLPATHTATRVATRGRFQVVRLEPRVD